MTDEKDEHRRLVREMLVEPMTILRTILQFNDLEMLSNND